MTYKYYKRVSIQHGAFEREENLTKLHEAKNHGREQEPQNTLSMKFHTIQK